MKTAMRAFFGVAIGCAAAAAFAQTISDPVSEIRRMSAAEVDATMAAIAQQTTAAGPVQPDLVTTIERAIYLKQSKTIAYTVRLSQNVAAADAAKTTAASLCRGRTALALMERGVLYQYSVTTPAQTYNIVFKRSDCPQ